MPNISSTSGIVYIVGAGPGDPRLITVKGLECLRNANPRAFLASTVPSSEAVFPWEF